MKADIHLQTNSLLILQVELEKNDIRSVIFSVSNGYSASELVGKKVVLLTNLKPAKFKGVLSEAMVIACEREDKSCGVLHSELNLGHYMTFKNPQTNHIETANCEDYIEKDDFLQMNFKGHDGKVYFNDIELEHIDIDKKLTGKIC